MAKIRSTEQFYSIQGEGKFVGQPSVFARMFGCNFVCQKFGLDKVPEVADQERSKVNPDEYEKFEDLPLVHTGCDSYSSWDPRFKRFTTDSTVEEFADLLTKSTPEGKWSYDDGRNIHLVMTGGEPLLGWQRVYPQLFELLFERGLKHVTFETNGTQKLQPKFVEWWNEYSKDKDLMITWSVSAKLSPSGHSWEEAIKPFIVKEYSELKNTRLYLKYVVANRTDFEEIEKATHAFIEAGVKIQDVYAMPVGGTTEGLQLTELQVAKLCMEKSYRYTPRLHCNLFGNNWGT